LGAVRGFFDPARDGFGFRNPVGMAPERTGGDTPLRRLDSFLYGSGLCFGMAAAALASFQRPASPYPLAALPLTPNLLGMLRGYHARQARPEVIVAAVLDWLRARGGRPEGLLDRLRLPGESTDPHVLNFGPALNGSFFRCLYRAHAVVPYRIEGGGGERRLYVYDPNRPGIGPVRLVSRRRFRLRRLLFGERVGRHARAALCDKRHGASFGGCGSIGRKDRRR
jgi:hypothetical protein